MRLSVVWMVHSSRRGIKTTDFFSLNVWCVQLCMWYIFFSCVCEGEEGLEGGCVSVFTYDCTNILLLPLHILIWRCKLHVVRSRNYSGCHNQFVRCSFRVAASAFNSIFLIMSYSVIVWYIGDKLSLLIFSSNHCNHCVVSALRHCPASLNKSLDARVLYLSTKKQ